MKKITLLLVISLLTIWTSKADTLDVPGTYSTIQAALDAAATGDVVLVQPGTYTENIEWPNVNGIILQSAGDQTNTTIDGSGDEAPVIWIDKGSNDITNATVIKGFHLTNGGSDLSHGGRAGAGIHFDKTAATLENLLIDNGNISGTSCEGGGIYMERANDYAATPIIINNVTIKDNQLSTGTTSKGGGIYTSRSDFIANNLTITNNLSGGSTSPEGGGIYIEYATVEITDGTISNNTCTGGTSPDGAGMYIGSSATVTLNRVFIQDNDNSAGGTSNKAGGIYLTTGSTLTGTNLLITGNLLSANSTTKEGAGIYTRGTLTLTNTTIADNRTIDNSAFDGGAIAAGSGTTTLKNCILWNPIATNEIEGTATITYSDVRGGYTGTGNLNIDPLFAGTSDYHLQATSPLIDAGTITGAPAEDIEQTPRTGLPDIGAYEKTNIAPTITHSTCLTPNSGAITIAVTGADAPYTYSWTGPNNFTANTQNISDLEAGAYTLTLTGNSSNTTVKTIQVNTAIEWQDVEGGLACGSTYIKPNSWLKFYGGTENEYPGELQQTSDGGLIFTATTPVGGGLAGHHGGTGDDAWVVKLDQDGNIQWSKLLGGTAQDGFRGIKEDASGNFAIAGVTYSTDGDIALNKGLSDYWVVKLDPSGNLLWSKTFGGSNHDIPNDIETTLDGGYLIGGQSYSNDGDVSGNNGANDYWLIKVDAGGGLVWEKTIGGASYEDISSIQRQTNGDFLIVGQTSSSNGDFAGVTLKGGADVGVVRVDANGNTLWVDVYGGTGHEGQKIISVETTGGNILSGRTTSTDGDIPSNQGGNDYWAFKIDNTGNIIWSKTYGGSGEDKVTDLRPTSNDEYLITGYTNSTDGDIHNYNGGVDIWTIRIDGSGNLLWNHACGGPNDDEGTSLVETQPGEFVLLGMFGVDLGGGTIDNQVCLKKITTVDCNGEDVVSIPMYPFTATAIGVSANRLLATTDGSINYIIEFTGKNQEIGLVYEESSSADALMNYGYKITPTDVEIVELGYVIQTIANYTIGDELQIARQGTDIIYTHNGQIIRTIATDATKVLLAKTVLREPAITELNVSFCNEYTFVIGASAISGFDNYNISGAGLDDDNITTAVEATYYPYVPYGETATVNITIDDAANNSTATISIELDHTLNVIASSLNIATGNAVSNYGIDNYLNANVNGAALNLNIGQLHAELINKSICDDGVNWTASKTFDENGNLTSLNKSYFNYLGNSTQSQTKNFTDDIVIATESVYDAYGRSVLTTLPAPTYEKTFCYKDDFITNGGVKYDYTKYDIPNYSSNASIIFPGEVDSPKGVDNADKGSLGWYYSDNNDEEPYVATTRYPYSRVEFDVNNPGTVKRSSAPHNYLRMGLGNEEKSFSMPASGELIYLFGYANGWILGRDFIFEDLNVNDFELTYVANSDLLQGYSVTKNITVDADGNESISFVDLDGKLVATCYSGLDDDGHSVRTLPITSFIKGNDFAERFVDIHLPEGTESTIVIGNKINSNTQSFWNRYDILDLDHNTYVYQGTDGQSLNLSPGYYRIIQTEGFVLHGKVDDVPINYELNYYDFTLYYYDKAGRLVTTVAPNGVDKTYDPNLVSVQNSNKKQFVRDGMNTPYLAPAGSYNKEVSVTIVPTPANSQQYTVALPFLSAINKPGVVPGGGGSIYVDNSNAGSSQSGSGGTNSGELDFVSFSSNNIGTNNVSYDEEDDYIPYAADEPDPSGCGGAYVTASNKQEAYSKAIGMCAADGSTVPVVFQGAAPGYWCVQCVPVANCGTCSDVKYIVDVDVIGVDNVNVNSTVLDRIQLVAERDEKSPSVSPWTFYVNEENIGEDFAFGSLINIEASENIDEVIVEVVDVRELVLTADPDYLFFDYVQTFNYDHIEELELNLTCVTNEFPGGYPANRVSSANQYNSISQLLKSVQEDAGLVEYVYSEEGLLRFSRNDKQKNEGTFSYTNYDELNRPIESGEYDVLGGTVFFQNHYQDYIFNGTGVTENTVLNNLNYDLAATGGTKNTVNYTQYDFADPSFNTTTQLPIADYQQKVYLGDVAKTWNDNVTTWYNYDRQGRVLWMVQQINGLGSSPAESIKTIDYVYNVKGDLEQVIYQKNTPAEYFAHEYTYDADKRLVNVKTSEDGTNWNQQAFYEYYQHGALKRTELADNLQGIDYLYTTLGQLKAINSPNLGITSATKFTDPGKDGMLNNFATDAFGMSIDYFSGDYTRENTFVNYGITQYENYNGNIKSVRWNTEGQAPPSGGENFMYAYQYNKKGWLKEANFGEYIHEACQNPIDQANNSCAYPNGTNNHHLFVAIPSYQVAGLTYDNNGNILGLSRNASGVTPMDNLTYHYLPNTNQLDFVNDAETDGPFQDLKQGQATGNYTYDEIGQLTHDNTTNEEKHYKYDVTGKVTGIYTDATGNTPIITIDYDDRGFRVKKTTYNTTTNQPVTNTWYVRDASGTIQHVVNEDLVTSSNSYSEYPLYAANRLGTYYKGGASIYELTDHLGNIRATISQSTAVVPLLMDYDFENSTDHLDWTGYNGGNVTSSFAAGKLKTTGVAPYGVERTVPTVSGTPYELNFETGGYQLNRCNLVEVLNDNNVVIASKQITANGSYSLVFMANSATTTIRFIKNTDLVNNTVFFMDNITLKKYGNEAIIESYADYYPFGEKLPGRSLQSSLLYKYAYQGQEHDGETGLEAFELRLWDGRIGRWLTTDPYGQYHSPYLGMGNNPVNRVDPNGGVDDWILTKDNKLEWHNDINSQSDFDNSGLEGTYIGEDLIFSFTSFIDGDLWDGPNPIDVSGEKLFSTVTLDFTKNSKGERTRLFVSMTSVIRTNKGGFKGIPYEGLKDFMFGLGEQDPLSFKVELVKHTRVNKFEERGLHLLGYKIVDVGQRLKINSYNGKLRYSAYTNIFPSASLFIGQKNVMYYAQPSFIKTHSANSPTPIPGTWFKRD